MIQNRRVGFQLRQSRLHLVLPKSFLETYESISSHVNYRTNNSDVCALNTWIAINLKESLFEFTDVCRITEFLMIKILYAIDEIVF